ncbi:UDP-N-acetylmuramate--L-alanine ligase [Micromonospora sp. NPDC049081]|uniref:UDP-N-acetylmuramate--L-alanine ligase n=1 Tax=Micromonospora sp. NPDC049081 TaxID=3155150 RepID=UPI0033E6B52B
MTDTITGNPTIEAYTGEVDLSRAHFVGIGGSAMSGLARLLAALGHEVSGSDVNDSTNLAGLRSVGVRVHVGHDAGHIAGASCVVYTTVARNAPEIDAARAAGIPVVHRAQVLDALAANRRLIAVSGSHGKSTTTAIVAHLLRTLGGDPTFLIGADLTGPGSGAHLGRSPLLVAEADESDRSFHFLTPSIAVITNVTDDHPENFVDHAALLRAYVGFGNRIAPTGFLVVNADCVGATVAADVIQSERPDVTVLRYGRDRSADVRLTDTRVHGWSGVATVRMPDGGEVTLSLPTPAPHHLHNAAAAMACATALGLDPVRAAAAAGSFPGVRRRFEHVDTRAGVTVVDSYADHPHEIAADLDAARALAGGRVIVVFQPSGHARVLAFGARIGQVLAGKADHVLLLDVHGTVPPGHSRADVSSIAARLPKGRYRMSAGPDQVGRLVGGLARPGDVLLTMGTGDVTGYQRVIMDSLGSRSEVLLSA